MKRNRGFTLVELIVVMACLPMVIFFFWTVLNSTSQDTYTLNEKIEVQNSVTSLMNIIQQDVQEAKIFNITESSTGIIEITTGGEYRFGSGVVYVFDSGKKSVTRKNGSDVGVYNNIVDFSMEALSSGNKYGVNVSVVGGMKGLGETDKSRYSLSTSYYTRNTM